VFGRTWFFLPNFETWYQGHLLSFWMWIFLYRRRSQYVLNLNPPNAFAQAFGNHSNETNKRVPVNEKPMDNLIKLFMVFLIELKVIRIFALLFLNNRYISWLFVYFLQYPNIQWFNFRNFMYRLSAVIMILAIRAKRMQ